MHTARRQSATDNGNQRCTGNRPFPPDSVGGRSSEETAETGAKEEEGIDGADDRVRVCGSWALDREVEVGEETWLSYASCEGSET